jgi:hypothetical protein
MTGAYKTATGPGAQQIQFLYRISQPLFLMDSYRALHVAHECDQVSSFRAVEGCNHTAAGLTPHPIAQPTQVTAQPQQHISGASPPEVQQKTRTGPSRNARRKKLKRQLRREGILPPKGQQKGPATNASARFTSTPGKRTSVLSCGCAVLSCPIILNCNLSKPPKLLQLRRLFLDI